MNQNKNDREALLPCPFCGGNAEMTCGSKDYVLSVACKECMAEMHGSLGEEIGKTLGRIVLPDADKKWNTRASQPTPAGKGEVNPLSEAFPHCFIGSRTFANWKEFAKRDDCLEVMVPSELREILSFAEKMQGCAEYWRDEMSEDKRELNKLRAQLSSIKLQPARFSEGEE